MNGGAVIGRLYVGNSNGISQGSFSLYDTFTVTGGNASSPTGDVNTGFVDSANSQGNIDGLGNVSSRMYNSGSTEWGVDANNSKQRYITTDIPVGVMPRRYSYLTISEQTADDIAANYQDPVQPTYVTFTLEPDTYYSNGVFNTHGTSVWFQVFNLSGATTEVFAGGLNTDCQLGQTCDSASWPYVTFDVATGNHIPGYTP